MDILDRLKQAQERDVQDMRLIERLSADGENPNDVCAKVIGGEFRLSPAVVDALAVV